MVSSISSLETFISFLLIQDYNISHLLGKPHGPDFSPPPSVWAALVPSIRFAADSEPFVPPVVGLVPLAAAAAEDGGSSLEGAAAVVPALPSSHAKLTLATAW